jgi:hypothetical protein
VNEDHDQIRALVAEYDSARLTPEERRIVEEHLAGCASCADLAEDVRFFRQQIRDGGEAMFEPHPEPAALRDFARGKDGPESRIGRHIRLCAICRLEVDAWKDRPAMDPAAARAEPGSIRPWIRLGLATAAAAILGVAAGWRFHASVSSSIAPPPSSGAPIASGGGTTPGSGGASGSGVAAAVQPPVLHLLPALLRGGGPPRQRWLLDRSESSIDVAVPVTMPVSAADMDRFRFELQGPGTEILWSQEMTAARIREHLEAAEVVNLIIAPPRALAEGDYEFRVVPSAAGAPPIYRARVTIAYRQSPAATKAPQ